MAQEQTPQPSYPRFPAQTRITAAPPLGNPSVPFPNPEGPTSIVDLIQPLLTLFELGANPTTGTTKAVSMFAKPGVAKGLRQTATNKFEEVLSLLSKKVGLTPELAQQVTKVAPQTTAHVARVRHNRFLHGDGGATGRQTSLDTVLRELDAVNAPEGVKNRLTKNVPDPKRASVIELQPDDPADLSRNFQVAVHEIAHAAQNAGTPGGAGTFNPLYQVLHRFFGREDNPAEMVARAAALKRDMKRLGPHQFSDALKPGMDPETGEMAQTMAQILERRGFIDPDTATRLVDWVSHLESKPSTEDLARVYNFITTGKFHR